MSKENFMPGPAPKPTAIKILEGNRGHRTFRENEPTPLAGEPTMPKHLDKEARREWRRLVPLLLSMRVLSEADGVALGILCSAYSTMIRAQMMLITTSKGTQSPLLIKTPSGYIMTSPLLSLINSQSEIVSKQLQQFGMTPSSRTRIAAAAVGANFVPGSWDDPLERKLCGD
jgi:P27 family predicted phage terminase small subunit